MATTTHRYRGRDGIWQVDILARQRANQLTSTAAGKEAQCAVHRRFSRPVSANAAQLVM
jgi:hypothetical protein